MASSAKSFYTCSCFYTNNYFIPEIGKHVVYNGRDEFIEEYGEICGKSRGASLDTIISAIEDEKARRLNLGEDSLKRREQIRKRYTPLHSDIFQLKESHLHPDFILLAKRCRSENKSDLLQHIESLKDADQVFIIPVFTKQFCEKLISELKFFEDSDLPKGRPNTMNNDGVLMDELGFNEGFLDPFREQYLQPIASMLFPEHSGTSLDSHKAFVVTYKVGRDEDLDFHFDNAEVTLNVSLSDDFTEGSLYFGAMNTEPVSKFVKCLHKVTHGVLHRGQHMHGALPIADGERYNLIMWMRSSSVRNRQCPMCQNEPCLVRTVGRGDGFTESMKDVCRLT